ncbi:MAG: HD family phosphohydrolase [Bacteroidota bacterium]
MLKRILNYIRNRHSLLFKGLLFLISLALIVYLFPHNLRFRYDLTKLEGRPWPYDKLVAPFDFAISKSAAELDAEQLELRTNRKLYFRTDSVATAAAKQRAAASGNAELKQFCDSVYNRGVFAWPKGIAAEEAIMLITGSVAEEQPVSRFVLRENVRAAFAQRFPELQPDSFITVSIRYDEILTERFLKQSLSNISKTRGAVSRDELLVDRGEIVDENIYLRLLSLQEDFEARSSGDSGFWQLIGGQLLLVAFCLFVLFQFLRLFRREVLANDAWLLFILLFVVLTVCMSYLPALFEGVPILALPFCILPVVMRAFFDTRIALFVHLITIFIITMTLPGDQFEFAFIQILSGIVAIFSIASMRNRSQLFFSVVIILGAYTVLYAGLKFITEADLRLVEWRVLRHYAISALLVLLAYPLIFSFEKIFGFVSDVTLLELSDTNNALLRELAERAPGTFQHSLQVANLAESAIRSIGGNPLLVRTGALYHDIGKADMPLYFMENQSTGVNPHNELSFEESATIIIDHVIRGIEKAKAAQLPDIITDFIRTHHGTTNTAYFLTLYKRNNPDVVVDEELFRYPGPEPYSKETAVLMMADATEASSRSLAQYDVESIDRLVESIIDHQVEQKQFNNCDITLKDISTIKKIFKKKLRSIYHVRVAYPK